MLQDLNFAVRLIVVPTVRESDGLALSSRNVYLTPEQRAEAPVLYASLRMAEQQLRDGEKDAGAVRTAIRAMIQTRSHGLIDYVSIAHAETLEELGLVASPMPVMISLAVRFGSTRLIDNISLTL
jgi:pantoate--beta-alanine ligase